MGNFGTRSGFDPIGLPNVLVVAIVWPLTISRICLSFALLLCNHHQRLRRTSSAHGLFIHYQPTQHRFIHSPSQPQTPSTCVWVTARVGHGVLMVRAFDRGDRRHPRHPVFMAGIRLRVDLVSEA